MALPYPAVIYYSSVYGQTGLGTNTEKHICSYFKVQQRISFHIGSHAWYNYITLSFFLAGNNGGREAAPQQKNNIGE